MFSYFDNDQSTPPPSIMLCFLVTNLLKTHLHCLNCLGSDYKELYLIQLRDLLLRFCPSEPVHKGITIVLSLFGSHSLAVVFGLLYRLL